MSAWADIKSKLKNAFDYVKANPILDAAATSLLQEIPIVGGFLVKLYGRAGDSQEDKSEIVLKSIGQLMQLDEEQFNKISKELNENRDIIIENIIENRVAITDLISRSTTEILEEIRKNKVQVLERVEEDFRDTLIKLNLNQSNIEMYTSLSKFKPGRVDCWFRGDFDYEEIMNGYDARRPVTDNIIKSIENNFGTIVYGNPYTGKSVLLKRIIIELVQKGYVVLYGDDIDASFNSLRGLLDSVTKQYDRLVLIVDNAHKSSSEVAFKAFYKEEPPKTKFLFAAREKQLAKETSDVISKALTGIPFESQFTLDFDVNHGKLLFKKAFEVSLREIATEDILQFADEFYENCNGDPFMFSLGLRYIVTTFSLETTPLEVMSFHNFVDLEMGKIIKKIKDFDDAKIWNAAIFGSLTGMTDLQISVSESSELMDCSDFTSEELRTLSNEGILVKE